MSTYFSLRVSRPLSWCETTISVAPTEASFGARNCSSSVAETAEKSREDEESDKEEGADDDDDDEDEDGGEDGDGGTWGGG